MNLEITGKLVEKYDTQTVNDRFRKREFVIEVTEEVNGWPSPTMPRCSSFRIKPI